MAVINVTHTSTTKNNLGRNAIVEWINNTAGTKHSKVEELCSGVAYCKCMQLLFPDNISIRKLKLNAKLEREYLHNMKLLQACFVLTNVVKVIPIDRLVKGRFQDNIEFIQWFKKFFDANAGGRDFRINKPSTPRPVIRPVKVQTVSMITIPSPSSITFTKDTELSNPKNKEITSEISKFNINPNSSVHDQLLIDINDDEDKRTIMKNTSDELLLNINDDTDKRMLAEKERDFYFGKLRKIEAFVQVFENQQISSTFKEALNGIEVILQKKI